MFYLNYFQIDEKIKEYVVPFLYNGGEGKMVPIQELVLTRNKDRPRHKLLPQNRETDSKSSFKASTTNVVKAAASEGNKITYF